MEYESSYRVTEKKMWKRVRVWNSHSKLNVLQQNDLQFSWNYNACTRFGLFVVYISFYSYYIRWIYRVCTILVWSSFISCHMLLSLMLNCKVCSTSYNETEKHHHFECLRLANLSRKIHERIVFIGRPTFCEISCLILAWGLWTTHRMQTTNGLLRFHLT